MFLFFGFGKVKNKLDSITLMAIVILFVFFLKSPSQKIFFFPVLLAVYLYDFNLKYEWVILTFAAINIIFGMFIVFERANLCTSQEIFDFAEGRNESIYFGVFQPYLDYRGMTYEPPYDYQITRNCTKKDYFIMEDWRQSQILFTPYKFCLEKWDGKYG